jgi:carbon monoxide dehydrogenase subunit G
MKIDVSFTVPVPPDVAFPLLLDVPRIAPCVPGASLSGEIGENHYKGQAVLKVGPVQLAFAGDAKITNIDRENRTARVIAKGADSKGRGSASATADFALVAEGAGTRVDVATELQLVGAVAQYGRASGLIKDIATQIVEQFAANLRQDILATPAAAPVDEATPTEPARPAAPAPARDLSAFSLLWGAIKAMLGRWLGKKQS